MPLKVTVEKVKSQRWDYLVTVADEAWGIGVCEYGSGGMPIVDAIIRRLTRDLGSWAASKSEQERG